MHPAWYKNSLLKLLPRQCQHIRSTGAEVEQCANPGPVQPPSAPHNSDFIVNVGQVLCSLVAAPSSLPLQRLCWWLRHTCGVEISKGRRKEKGVANNYASLSYPGLACIHQIPFMLGLPTAAPVIASFPGTMVDSCLLLCRLWCTLSLACHGAASLLTYLVAMFCVFFFFSFHLFNQI